MQTMKLIPMAVLVAAVLIVPGARAADTADAGATRTDPPTPVESAVNRNLAREATTAAAEDAIEAVRVANRLHLDIRLNGRKSAQASEQQANGR